MDSAESTHTTGIAEQYTPGSKYLLSRTEEEKNRLNIQHRWLIKHSYKQLVVDQSIQLPGNACILDAGTGTGAWLCDMGNELPDTAKLHGIDVSDKLFPQDHPSNMKFQVASVTALPSEWSDKFDLINQRLLVAALRTDEWEADISEIYRVLRPGGHVQICEVLSSRSGRTEAHGKVKAIVYAWCAQNGIDYDCAHKIPGKLTEAGFVNIKTKVTEPPNTYKQGSEGRIGKDTVLRGWWMSVKEATIKNGGFGVVSSEQECEDLFKAFYEEEEVMDDHAVPFVLITAQKPDTAM